MFQYLQRGTHLCPIKYFLKRILKTPDGHWAILRLGGHQSRMHHKYLPPALALHWELKSPLGYISPSPQQIIFWVLLNKKGHIPRGTSPPGYHLGRCCSLMLTQ
ncbi:hypothetical protein XENTR_v10023147 [Xenopus tropicalis]|nr:hypothetical protein XENTR_v10023147 [Xenopus tropicalis]